jgi:hypothetical protein
MKKLPAVLAAAAAISFGAVTADACPQHEAHKRTTMARQNTGYHYTADYNYQPGVGFYNNTPSFQRGYGYQNQFWGGHSNVGSHYWTPSYGYSYW